MPDVFVSNYMKQQRNFVHYKRFKKSSSVDRLTPEIASKVTDKQDLALPKSQHVKLNTLLMIIRVKESRNTTPQAQKILKELGLKEINNVSFVRADSATLDKLLLIRNYVAYGQPTKALLDEIIRKRGYMRKQEEGKAEQTRVPISDNVVVEDLLGSKGIICIEDLIEAFWKCKTNPEQYEAARTALWPIQLAPLKEDTEKANTTHDATGRTISKKTTLVSKGGYLGMMGDKINEFVSQLV